MSRLRRMGWSFADQSLSSLSNFLLGVAVARSVSQVSFGAFSLAFALYTLYLGLGRATASDPILIRFTNVSERDWRMGAAEATGTGLSIGIAGALVLVVGGWASGDAAATLVALGIALPGLLLQDQWRFVFFARGESRTAFLNDAIWALALLPAFAVPWMLGSSEPAHYILAWGSAATLASFAGVLQSGVRPRITSTQVWLRRHKDLIPRYVGEFVAMTGSIYASLIAVTAIAGLAAAGALRGAQLLLGPFNVLLFAAGTFAVPEAIRSLAVSRQKFRRWCALISLGLSLAAISLGVLLSALPSSLGKAVLGETWVASRPLVLPVALALGGSGAANGALVGLRALAEARSSLSARLIGTTLIIAAVVVGTIRNGAEGAAWGSALGAAGAAVIWWWAFWRIERSQRERDAIDESLAPTVTGAMNER